MPHQISLSMNLEERGKGLDPVILGDRHYVLVEVTAMPVDEMHVKIVAGGGMSLIDAGTFLFGIGKELLDSDAELRYRHATATQEAANARD